MSSLSTPFHKIPKVTFLIFLLTAIITGLQFFFPNLRAVLERTPEALAARQWWRLITPVLINPEGWRQIIFNFLGIAIAGTMVERLFGGRRWLILYVIGGFVGEIAGIAWRPVGAGSSVAVCGLVGALAAWMLLHKARQPRFGGTILLTGSLILIALRDLHGPPLLAGAIVGLLMLLQERRMSTLTLNEVLSVSSCRKDTEK
jgi:membrane associated rhomboid family serine protease